jgi:hypothetical protein
MIASAMGDPCTSPACEKQQQLDQPNVEIEATGPAIRADRKPLPVSKP